MNVTAQFESYNQLLRAHKRAIPFLLIDLALLDKNIHALQTLIPEQASFRIVVKSLPSLKLLEYIMAKMECRNLMVFHQPFLSDLAQHCDADVDILLGKPMPIKTATYFYENFDSTTSSFNPFTQIQWLIDTKERMLQYLDLANKYGQPLRLNLEIDVGLHRGGFRTIEDLRDTLKFIQQHPAKLELSGLMGYDPHVVKLPKVVRSVKKAARLANDFYVQCKDLIRTEFSELWTEQLVFNGAGSPTLTVHQTDSPLNDISAGSCLVKPTTFDIPTLSDFVPAAFIAAPVLKKLKGTTLPALERLAKVLGKFKASNQMSYFIYGGFWKADYYYPEGLSVNKLFGESTNQTMVNASANVHLEVDDYVFLRPHQSEFVFLQFGDILAIRNGEIVDFFEGLDEVV